MWKPSLSLSLFLFPPDSPFHRLFLVAGRRRKHESVHFTNSYAHTLKLCKDSWFQKEQAEEADGRAKKEKEEGEERKREKRAKVPRSRLTDYNSAIRGFFSEKNLFDASRFDQFSPLDREARNITSRAREERDSLALSTSRMLAYFAIHHRYRQTHMFARVCTCSIIYFIYTRTYIFSFRVAFNKLIGSNFANDEGNNTPRCSELSG